MELTERNKYVKPLLCITLFLMIIQAVRSGMIYGLSKVVGTDLNVLDLTSTGSFILLGGLLWFLFKPDRKSLGLDLAQTPKWGKAFCLVLAILIPAAIVSGLVVMGFTWQTISATVHSVIVTPIYEELIFRGYIWNHLKGAFKKEVTVYITTTILFALWHLGYAVDVYLRTGGAELANIMLMKVLVGAGFGAIAGLLRWKTRNTYSAILIHALMNVFGR